MPNPCFSCPADVPPEAGLPGTAQSGLDEPRRMPWSCYSYPIMCFSYPDDMPFGGGSRDIGPAPLPGPRKMPLTCFSY